jgi:predicted RNA-binding protein YlxR (DUF448 family)
MASPAKGPVRKCIGCGVKGTKNSLIRLVVDEENRVVWDLQQIKPGRGAYLCPARDCLTMAIKRGGFKRAFRKNVRTDGIEGPTVPWSEQQK